MPATVKHWRFLMVLSFVFILIAGGVALAQEGTSPEVVALLYLEPQQPTILIGDTGVVDIMLSDVVDVYGIQLQANYDPAILSVEGSTLAPGVCPMPELVVSNTAVNGQISYAASQLLPMPPCSGGLVASMTLMCAPDLTTNTPSDIVFTGSLISDINGTPIAHNSQDLTVICSAAAFFIEGSVFLQSWPSPEGVIVTLFNDTDGIQEDLFVVGADGSFAFIAEINKLYTVTASHPRYLDTEKSGLTSSVAGDTVVIGTGTLNIGDLNGDGVINILDLTALAGNFFKSSPQPW